MFVLSQLIVKNTHISCHKTASIFWWKMESEAFTKERIWHGAILCSGFEENEQKTFDSITLSRLGLEQNEQKSTSILTRSQAMKQYAFVDKVETAICAVKFLLWPRDAIMIIHVKWDNWGFLLRGNTSIRQCVHSWHSSGSCLASIPFKRKPSRHGDTAKCVYRK